MATIQLGRTKAANRLLSYAEARAEEISGVDCVPELAKTQMKATRAIWGKTEGIQAHHVIQSFAPGEVTPTQANEIGQDLAKEIAKDHEAMVYTHTDKEHIHNHIVINAVNMEDGRKYQAHGKEAITQVREQSDRLCQEHGLSVIQEQTAGIRHTLAEQALLEKGQSSWKDEIREVVDVLQPRVGSLEELQQELQETYNITMKIRGNTVSYVHPENERAVRGKKLGSAYEKEGLEHGFARQDRRRKEVESFIGRNEGAQSTDDGLHSRTDGPGDRRKHDGRPAAHQNSDQRPAGDANLAIEHGEARKHLEKRRRALADGFSDWKERDATEQRTNRAAHERDRTNPPERSAKDEKRRDQPDPSPGSGPAKDGAKRRKRNQELSR